jgi:hypothetical protein
MNATPTSETLTQPQTETGLSFSRLIRRIHMFTGLFLAPWMLMYALSTLVMTHREFVVSLYPSQNPAMVTEHELDYTRTFSPEISRDEIGRQILQDLGLAGRHYLSGGRNGEPLVINRQHALALRRVTFNSATHKVLIQREEFRVLTFLERMHRRRGYDQPYPLEDTWGFTVDLAVVTMAFWSLSGIWLWWELKSTRFWGVLSFFGGLGLFAIFSILI